MINKPTHELVMSTLNVEQLKKEVLAVYDRFDEYSYRRTAPGSPHSEMTDLWVRFNDLSKQQEGHMTDEHDSVWYPIADKLPALKDVVFNLMREVEGERLGGILITKLNPGGKIMPHIDTGWHASYYDKFFVPVLIKPEATFGFIDGNIHAKEGEAWWFDNSQLHWVTNNTDSDRLAMIVCIRTEKYKDKNARRI